jgi:glycosyltransferase involved in cell wall biosynthesis
MTEPLRTLFITVDPPYPATSGAPLRNWQNVSLAAAAGPVAVLSIGYGEPGTLGLPGVAEHRHLMLQRGAEGSVRGFPSITGPAAEAVVRAAAETIATFGPAVVVLENVWIEGIAAVARGSAQRLVYDAHNVYADVAQELGLDANAVRALESAVLRAVDALWVCSENDADRIRGTYPFAAPLQVVPNGIDTDHYSRVRARVRRVPSTAITLLFVGSYWYEPNRLAAELLLSEIVPTCGPT